MFVIVSPVSCTWVKVISELVPKCITAASDNIIRSSPITASLTTLKPPSVCKEPSVVEVASVASSVFRIPENVPVDAVNAAVANVPPATVKVLDECVTVMSPLLKLSTPPLATNKSDHIKEVVPNATPSLVTGDKAFSTSSTSLTLLTLKIILLSVDAKSIRF